MVLSSKIATRKLLLKLVLVILISDLLNYDHPPLDLGLDPGMIWICVYKILSSAMAQDLVKLGLPLKR